MCEKKHACLQNEETLNGEWIVKNYRHNVWTTDLGGNVRET